MRLVRLSVKNFRSISDTISIDVPSQHVVLVGANNAGKSNIISALDWVLGSRQPYQLRADEDDYFDSRSPIVIEAILGDVSPSDKSALMGIATNKQQRGALASNTDPVVTFTLTIPPLEPGTDESEDEDSEDTTAARPALDIKLWGFQVYRRQTDIRRQLVQIVRVASERNVGDDLQASRWTPYGQLMKVVMEGSPDYQNLIDVLGQLNSDIQTIFANEKAALLSNAQVVSYVDDISFQLTRQNNPAELLRYLEILVTEEGHQINISKVGTGTQNAVIIGMLELALRSKTSRVKIFTIEEPDSFIHPHGVRHLAKLIRRIGDDDKCQVFLTTHSAALVSGLAPRDIVRVEKRGGKTKVFQATGTLGDPTFARYINSESAEMFFARRVVLVEGDTERFLLPPLASMLTDSGRSLDFDQHRISVISMDTKDNIVNYLKILDEFEINAVAVLDADFLGGGSCKALIRYLRAKGISIDDSTNTQLTKDLTAQGIFVLSKGEIEDYIPEADVAEATDMPLTAVQTEMTKTSKTSDAFKKIFHSGKPAYGRQLAEFYIQRGSVPSALDQLIRRLST